MRVIEMDSGSIDGLELDDEGESRSDRRTFLKEPKIEHKN